MNGKDGAFYTADPRTTTTYNIHSVWTFFTPKGECIAAQIAERDDLDPHDDFSQPYILTITDGSNAAISIDLTDIIPTTLVERVNQALAELEEERKPPPPKIARPGRRSNRFTR